MPPPKRSRKPTRRHYGFWVKFHKYTCPEPDCRRLFEHEFHNTVKKKAVKFKQTSEVWCRAVNDRESKDVVRMEDVPKPYDMDLSVDNLVDGLGWRSSDNMDVYEL